MLNGCPRGRGGHQIIRDSSPRIQHMATSPLEAHSGHMTNTNIGNGLQIFEQMFNKQ